MDKFNTDIGLDSSRDHPYYRSQYPEIADFLIWPKLIEAFKAYEDKAVELKRNVRIYGIAAICLATIALSVAAISSKLSLPGNLFGSLDTTTVLASVSLFFILLAVALGRGVLFGHTRDEWLVLRLKAERIRQFHFQFIMVNFRSIASDDFGMKRNLLVEREKQLQSAQRKIEENGYHRKVVQDEELSNFLLAEGLRGQISELHEDRLEQLQKALIELRFEHQSGYAAHQLRKTRPGLSLTGSIADKARGVNNLEFIATIGLLLLQTIALICQIVAPQLTNLIIYLSLFVSLFALSIVALKSYEEGLHLPQDLTRNRTYAAGSAKLLREFRTAKSNIDIDEQIKTLERMEELAYFETREFVITHSESRFSI